MTYLELLELIPKQLYKALPYVVLLTFVIYVAFIILFPSFRQYDLYKQFAFCLGITLMFGVMMLVVMAFVPKTENMIAFIFTIAVFIVLSGL